MSTVGHDSMRKAAATMFWLIAATAASSECAVSERLLHAALADHFTRYFCVKKYPELRPTIQEAYDASRLRHISIPCRGLKCADAEFANGMKTLFVRAKELSEAETMETCEGYESTLQGIEQEFDEELTSLYGPSGSRP